MIMRKDNRCGAGRRRTARGFTLIELMITVGIIVFAVAGLFSSFVHAVLLNESTDNLVKAANDAQYVLEQMKGVAYGSLGAYVPPSLNSLPGESIAVQQNPQSRISEVTVNVSWTERNRNRSFALSTRFAR